MIRGRFSQPLKYHLVILLFALVLAACSPTTQKTLTLAVSPTQATPSRPTETQAPLPSPTDATQFAVLVTPDGVDPDQVSLLQEAMTSLSQSSGLELRVVTDLHAVDISPSVRIVVVLPPDPGLVDLAKAFPKTQFVSVGIGNITPAENISVIGAQGYRSDQQAFIAGYAGAIVTDDYRVGVLSPSGEEGTLIETAFSNGVRFYCGLCRPAYPPYVGYPTSAEIENPGDTQSWQTAADTLLQASVTTVYVSPTVSSADLLNYLVQNGIQLIGGENPPDAIKSEWVATIAPSPATDLTPIWPDLMDGKGGADLPMPFALTDTSSGLLSAARQRLVDATIQDLINGFIEPVSAP